MNKSCIEIVEVSFCEASNKYSLLKDGELSYKKVDTADADNKKKSCVISKRSLT